MKPLQRAIIEKVGNDNGFEHVLSSMEDVVVMVSARHRVKATVNFDQDQYEASFISKSPSLLPELERQFQRAQTGCFCVNGEAELARLLRRAAALAQALPNQAVVDYETKIETALQELPHSIIGTEVERMVRQRVGQQTFRQAQMGYWGSACAVTGIAIPEVLRASHAKPWANCQSDAERLDVFNGFLLSANLDALFDRFLITFDENGQMMVSSAVSTEEQQRLAISNPLTLRWLAAEHQPYLAYHRELFSVHG